MMKRRHPRQVVDHAAFRPGDEYALVRATEDPDAPRRTSLSCETMTFAGAIDGGSRADCHVALGRHPVERGRTRFTIHDIHGQIVVAVWSPQAALSIRSNSSWVFTTDSRNHHELFVPSADWAADPRVHVVDWVNPDDACEAEVTWVEEEARLRRKRDIAMRIALGFDE